ncbi:MAG: tetratricopeptide repeat protein [Bradymonadaceae bacterium]|nr:tetratricopeptide repeat protein [Lujinxingiaceae bacterium]
MLKTYIERVMALRDQRHRSLNASELRTIAQELGMSDADIAASEEAGRAYLARGRGYLAHGRLDDAIRELEEAAILLPGEVEALRLLASGHRDRWFVTGKEESRAAAREFARQCIDADANDTQSYTLLNELEGPRPAQAAGGASVRSNARQMLAVAGAFLSVSVMLAAFVLFAVDESNGEPVDVGQGATGQVEAAPQPKAAVSGSVEPEVDLDVELVADARSDGLKLVVRHSRLKNFADRSFYELHAGLLNEGKFEVEAIKVRSEFLGADGQPAYDPKNSDAMSSHQAIIRPGDLHVFSQLTELGPRVERVRLTVTTIDKQPSGGVYGTSRPIEVGWEIAQPEHLRILVRERSQSFSSGSLNDKGYFRASLEVENQGSAAIRTLKLGTRLFDKDGRELEKDQTFVAHGGGAALLPGETRVVSTITNVAQSYDHYKLVVVSAE